ncbi:hypothetical protein RM697_02520 [Ichthyenterobacterium sp. W332]|uniref:RDD domain-containing protein n=1 Tax=Microcosmobacter mediterraneus TaxID=3075607 RepID=A0ABU2YIA7_9FLAO|nr:hypothetical protein [Ichthyenterobacterium sp. W332]MDT0557505.1 hypothetical protein [Ichthyenterobacterium sp. W332]
MIRQNPFSLYDFLGYFIPGATLIYLMLFFSNLDSSEYAWDFNNVVGSDNVSIQNYLFFIIISYAVGHLINFLSSILVERYGNWMYDYPSKYLLKIHKKFSFKTITIKRIGIFISILPVSILDLLLGQLFNFKNLYVQHLDDFLIHGIKTKSSKILTELIPEDESNNLPESINDYDFFRILHHYAFEHTKSHQFKMVNYVVLYGFLRSLTFICVIIFWYLVYLQLFEQNEFIFAYHYLIISLCSYIFFMAFMKFYRRYTLEALMIIAIENKKE